MNTYTTLDTVRKYLSLGSADNADDENVLGLIKVASRAIDKYTRRHFYPTSATRFYSHDESQRVKLDEDLLSLTTFKTQNGASTLSSGVLFLMTGDEWNTPPYDRIVINESAGCVLTYSGTPQKSNEVTGLWGYHENYESAWIDTGTSLATSYGASGGSIGIAGGSTGTGSSDVNGEAPRISVGNKLRIGDEFFDVYGGNGSIINVTPYANGTTAASHAASTTVYKFAYEPDIEWAATRLTTWVVGQQMTPYQTKTAFLGLGQLSIPEAWPPDARDRLDRFVRRKIATMPRNKNISS